MPAPRKEAPDDEDVYNCIAAIGEECRLLVRYSVEYQADFITSIARAYKVGAVVDEVVVFQAYHRRRYRPAITQAQVNFTLAYDIYMQATGGGATAAKRGAPRDYTGRVLVPRRRTAQ